MKIKTLALASVAIMAFTLSVSPVYAEDTPQPPPPEAGQDAGTPPPEGAKGGPRAEEMENRGKERFDKTDTNRDGFLSKEEMEAEHQARLDEMFTKTDADHDGKLSPEELKKGREVMREKFREKFKERRELNKSSGSSQ